ncbi:MAG: glycosyltransferase [Deltaproteobacteria bacterium]|nr:glycosyltransferase [Deltaproteobacteria bacterium]
MDVIIVNYNSTNHLLRCLRSIFDSAAGIDLKVRVQDNHSRDGVARVGQIFPQVRLHRNESNLGFARAVNQGLKQSSSSYVLILNPDTILNEGFFEKVTEYMDTHPETGIMGPKIFDSDGSVQGSARLFPNLLTALFGRKSLLTKIFPSNPVTRENIMTGRSDGINPMDVDWVSGACMVVRRAAIEDVGFMDDGFFMYWEDADWCRRMWIGGWKVVYYPQPSIIHYVGISSRENVIRSVVAFHKSIYRLFKKHAKKPRSILTPIVYWGLIYRLLFVLGFQCATKTLQGLNQIQPHRLSVGIRSKDAKIKVVRFIARLNIGGPSIHVHLLNTGLDKARFVSILVAGKISSQEGDMSYLFESFPDSKPIIIKELQREISPIMDIKAFFQILKILSHEDPDIVHTHTAKAGTSARIAVLLYNALHGRNIQMVHTFHGHVFEGYFSPTISLMFTWIERILALFTDVIIAISKSQQSDLSTKFRITTANKIRIVPLGFNLRPFLECDPLKGRFRASTGLMRDAILIGIVGRLVPVKRHLMFLEAAKYFVEYNPGMTAQFLIVGDGELKQELRFQTIEMGLSKYVRFCGWRRDLPEVYRDVDILSLTSVNEGTPVSIIEAMAAATPVIATDVGGVSDLLGSNGEHPDVGEYLVCARGILCCREDPIGFAKGLTCLVKMDARERDLLGQKSRDFVRQKFSDRRLLNDIETLYLELTAKSRRK